ncbi:unnamed protein product [Arabidopsis halleri]
MARFAPRHKENRNKSRRRGTVYDASALREPWQKRRCAMRALYCVVAQQKESEIFISDTMADHPSQEMDPGRKHGTPDPTNRNKWTCNHCFKTTNGGISRHKQHLVGGFRNATKCKECPEHVREEIKAFMMRKAELKAAVQMTPPPPEFEDYDDG